MSEYQDARIVCGDDAVVIKGYYFPWGSKRVAYRAITGLTRVTMGALTGRWRIWGTANPRLWANFDPARPRKTVGFILNGGRTVRPFLTPDDPDAFEAVVRERAHLPAGEGPSPSPFL